jgi:hypothetical protein
MNLIDLIWYRIPSGPYRPFARTAVMAFLLSSLAVLVAGGFSQSSQAILTVACTIWACVTVVTFSLLAHNRLRGVVNDCRSAVAVESSLRQHECELNEFFMEGAAATPSLHLLNLKVLLMCRPERVLELGSGQTTKVLSWYAEQNKGTQVITLEQDPIWADVLSSHIHHNIVVAPLVPTDFTCGKSRKIDCGWYDVGDIFNDLTFDYVLVDGPDREASSRNTPFSRVGILQFLPDHLASKFVVVFDDAERSGEQRTIDLFCELLREKRTPYGRAHVHGVKRQEVVFSPDYSFLRSV